MASDDSFIHRTSGVSKRRVPSLPIIEDFQPFKDDCPRLIVGLEMVPGQECTFEGGEKLPAIGLSKQSPTTLGQLQKSGMRLPNF
jgi:hypothetical protein